MARVSKFSFVIAALLSLGFLHAQVAAPLARHPGDVVKYEIKFDGPNADRIKTVYARMNMGQPPKDQAGFTSQFNTPGQVQPSSPKTFLIEMKVPDNAANGEYTLFVTATADEGSANYQEGQEFNVPPVHIENPKKFVPPSVKVTPLP
jgi:hypothetical protein